MAKAFVFPGQGSQAVGMGQALAEAYPAAREVFEEVDEALGQHLFRLMKEGPESDLTLTENAQPAIMAASLAVVRVLESEGGFSLADKGSYVAGHSLGEYSALTAAGAFSLADGARLLKRRGRAMQEATPVGTGAMAALLGLDLPEVQAIAAEAAAGGAGGEVCQAANDNAPGQVVVSGHAAAVERAIELAKEKGAKRAVLLPVSAPFHCALMQPAADVMAEALEEVTILPPALPVVSNVLAQPVSEPVSIRRLLVEQVTGMVRWREGVLAMKGLEVDTLVELGNGKVLSGLTRRIDREMESLNAGAPEEIEALLKSL
ncbi:ACP S-malonyltransferase [Limibacillus halophilus]